MKRCSIFLMLLLGIISNGYSQEFFNNVRFGIRAGVNLSYMNISEGFTLTPIETSGKAGGVVGLLMIVPISGKFYIQPEYLFSQMGGKTPTPERTYSFNYISLPVLLRWHALERLSFLAGPQVSLLINSKQKSGETTAVITKNLEDRSLGATIGAEYHLNQSFVVGVRYMKGINHIDYSENFQFKFEMVQVSTVYFF